MVLQCLFFKFFFYSVNTYSGKKTDPEMSFGNFLDQESHLGSTF